MSDSARREVNRARALLALLVAAYLVFAASVVPRLTNTVMSDVDLTGWTTPLAARLVGGEKLYDDFAVPLPPGGPLLLAAVQRMQGRALVLQELWIVALCHLGMALVAYLIGARLTSRKNALLTAAATLALLASVPQEVAFSSLAQLSAWVSLALGIRALLAATPRAARRAWIATGFFAGSAFAFHQLVAAGAIVGWLAAFGYRFGARRWAKDSGSPLPRELAAFSAGACVAIIGVALLALATGSSLHAFVRNVLGDAAVLSGSWQMLGKNLVNALVLRHTVYPSSLVLTSIAVAVGLAVARRAGLSVGDEAAVQSPLAVRQVLSIAAVVVASFAGAAVLLATRSQPLPAVPSTICASFGALPSFGLLYAGAFWVANVISAAQQAPGASRSAHAFNAFVLAALASSVVSSLTFAIDAESRFVERPSIALGFLCLFIALGRARLGWLRTLALVASMLSLFGPKLNRALLAHTPVEEASTWQGLRVSYRGEELLRAAERVRTLAGSGETVLVLPEDAHLSALFGRPRPPLRAALVFVHTYPARLTDADIERLATHPPKVIVIHPRREEEWRNVFSKWAEASGAAAITEYAMTRLIPRRYRLDSSFRSVAFEDMGQLDIWVRVDLPTVPP